MPILPTAEGVALVGATAIQHEILRRGPATQARLDPEGELRVNEPRSRLVQQQAVARVTERITHPGRNENIGKTIGVEVADARSPWPPGFRACLFRDFRKLAAAEVLPQRVAEDVIRRALQVFFGPLDFAKLLRFHFLAARTRPELQI